VHAFCVNYAVIKTTDIEEQPSVAKVARRPAVPTRPNTHPMAVDPGVPHRGDDILDIFRLHNDIWEPVRQAAVPYGCAPGWFVAVLATEEMPSSRK